MTRIVVRNCHRLRGHTGLEVVAACGTRGRLVAVMILQDDAVRDPALCSIRRLQSAMEVEAVKSIGYSLINC